MKEVPKILALVAICLASGYSVRGGPLEISGATASTSQQHEKGPGSPPPSASRPPRYTATTGGIRAGGPTGNLTDVPTLFARDLSQSPLFAVTSGLASILGLLFALYATQVRTIPFSLCRSLMWRKALLLSSGIGLFVFGIIRFCTQDEAPYLSPLREAHAALLGVLRVSPDDYQPHGPTAWAVIALIGLLLSMVGVFYDPTALAREIITREYAAISEARDKQIYDVLRGRDVTTLEYDDRRILDDTLDYYRHVHWRFADAVLGAPPPALPFFYERERRTGNEPDHRS